jgi:hypothetical protein
MRQQVIDTTCGSPVGVDDPSQVIQELGICIWCWRTPARSRAGQPMRVPVRRPSFVVCRIPAAVVEAKKTSRDARLALRGSVLNDLFSEPITRQAESRRRLLWETGKN